jgi:hypothetical protein
VRAAKAVIYCSKGEDAIEADQFATNDDRGKRDWNFDRPACQHGQNQLVVEKVHLMIR